jgi:hypothetical protein
MAEAKQVDEWNRMSLLCMLVANPNRDTKKHPQPFGLHEFHPFMDKPQQQSALASSLFAKLERIDGIQPSVVTETTWQTPQTLLPAVQP